ncbi:ABC transporter ATP-binding protein [Aquibium sp. LZ166]|uniref:ABC transporter ATP-binding protein n=1 Tax=Aquibium pacificus TaxID=3153579 RepID=A0ABV3SC51_9HYPH
MTDNLLEAIGLQKSFGALKVAQDVTLRLRPGERHALIGPNGAGKSTLVALLSGVLALGGGRILLGGRDISRSSPSQRTREGLVRTFQVSNLFGGLTVLENVYLAISERAGASFRLWRPAYRNTDLIGRSHEILEQLGLGDVARTRVDQLAYGQQRLLEIAIALALRPKVLLLDEPTAGIPSTEAGILLDALDRLPPEIAILLIEHDMQVVRRFASTVTVLVEGKILMTGSPIEVMSSEEVRSVYLGKAGQTRFASEVAHA